jgi:hypothetical protein
MIHGHVQREWTKGIPPWFLESPCVTGYLDDVLRTRYETRKPKAQRFGGEKNCLNPRLTKYSVFVGKVMAKPKKYADDFI